MHGRALRLDLALICQQSRILLLQLIGHIACVLRVDFGLTTRAFRLWKQSERFEFARTRPAPYRFQLCTHILFLLIQRHQSTIAHIQLFTNVILLTLFIFDLQKITK
jgi:hypothetical protein